MTSYIMFSRGLGLEFVTQLLTRTNGRVIGLMRNTDSINNLTSLKSTYSSRFEAIQVDLEDQDSVEAAGTKITNLAGHVNVLINVAGLLGDGKTTPGPERSLAKLDRDWLTKSLEVDIYIRITSYNAL